jgi:hypothetical protein
LKTAHFVKNRKLIQEGAHNPTVDAKASLQLVLLKLRHGLDFGDVIINGCTNSYDEALQLENKIDIDNLDMTDPATVSKFIYQTGLNIDQDFFHVLRDSNLNGEFKRFF